MDKIEDCNGVNGHNPLLPKDEVKETFEEEPKLQQSEVRCRSVFSRQKDGSNSLFAVLTL